MESQSSLPYQPPHPRRPWRARWIILFAIAVALFIFSKEAPFLFRRAQLLYWQGQCMTYKFPPNAAIAITTATAGPMAPPWRKFYEVLNNCAARSDGTVFLHKLVSPGGNHRLVAVDLYRGLGLDLSDSVNCRVSVITPGTPLSDPAESFVEPHGYLIAFTTAPITVSTGAIDPVDFSHFTIKVDQSNRTDKLDFWLRDDDRVVFELHALPSTQPLPPSSQSSP